MLNLTFNLWADIPFASSPEGLLRWENVIWAGIATLTSALVEVARILSVIKPGL